MLVADFGLAFPQKKKKNSQKIFTVYIDHLVCKFYLSSILMNPTKSRKKINVGDDFPDHYHHKSINKSKKK